MTNPLLIFIDAADDAIAMPLSRMIGMTVAADSTIIMNFENVLGANATEDKRTFATLTITADKELLVFKALAEKIAGIRRPNKDIGYVTICDDVNSVFAHPNILSCTVTLDA